MSCRKSAVKRNATRSTKCCERAPVVTEPTRNIGRRSILLLSKFTATSSRVHCSWRAKKQRRHAMAPAYKYIELSLASSSSQLIGFRMRIERSGYLGVGRSWASCKRKDGETVNWKCYLYIAMWRALNQYVVFEAAAEFTLSCGNMYGEKQMLII